MSRFTDFFSNLGHGLSSGLSTIGHGISSIGKPLLGAVGQIAPMAGTLLGGTFGGPRGALLGNSLGGLAGNLFGQMSGGGQQGSMGGGQPAQSPSSPQELGQNFGGQAGNYLNQMLPQNMQGMTLGQMGTSLQNQFGSRLNQMLPPQLQGMGLGQRAAGFLGNQLSSRIPGGFLPQGFQNQSLSGLGSMLGGQAGNYFGSRFNTMPSMETPSFAHGGHFAHGGLRDMAELLGHHSYEEGAHAY